MGSWENHAQHCIEMWNVIGQRLIIRVTNGQEFIVRKMGLIHLRINDQILLPCEILLVDHASWDDLFITNDILSIYGLDNQEVGKPYESGIDRKVEPKLKLMPVRQDIADGCDNDVKPRTIPGRKPGKDSFGLYDLETQYLE